MNNKEFARIIAGATDISLENILKEIKEDDSYPVSPDFEEGLAEIMENFATYAKLLDSQVEHTPMEMEAMMDAAGKAMETSGMTGVQMQVASIFQTALNELYEGVFDSRLVMPSSSETLGPGVLKIYFNRITGSFNELVNSPDGKLNDFIENYPCLILYLDTTPGEEGFRSFLVEYREGL